MSSFLQIAHMHVPCMQAHILLLQLLLCVTFCMSHELKSQNTNIDTKGEKNGQRINSVLARPLKKPNFVVAHKPHQFLYSVVSDALSRQIQQTENLSNGISKPFISWFLVMKLVIYDKFVPRQLIRKYQCQQAHTGTNSVEKQIQLHIIAM